MIDSVPGNVLKLAGITMELPRRKFLHLAIGAAALPTWLDAALRSIIRHDPYI